MALNFPNSPVLGQQFQNFTWNGTVWTARASDNASYNNVGRNLLHNSMFRVQQRGQGPWTVNAAYTADRWVMALVGGTYSIQINTATDTDRTQIGDETVRYCLGANCVGSSGAGDQTYFEQRIEDVRRLSVKTVTVSFWAVANSGTPKLGVNLYQIFGTGGSPSTYVGTNGQSVTLTTTWARYSLTFSLSSTASKTFGTNNDSYTILRFWQSCGTTNAVFAGNIGVQSYTLSIWGVQLEFGSIATPLEKIDIQTDFANCQRFYNTTSLQMNAYNAAGLPCSFTYPWPVLMRASPTVNLTRTGGANDSSPNAAIDSRVMVFSFVATAAGYTAWAGYFTATADL